ncbi:MAG: FUSC family protein [Butyricicoccus sp.]|nr:FUSC family protein [Butyricicoccus sp.]
MKLRKMHIGLRAVKTALSVGISMLVARLLGSSLPIFAVIGAISAMSRNLNDTLHECLNQIIGTFIGFVVATVFVRVLPDPAFFLWMGVGTLLVTALCLRLKVQFAVPLACIVFADICLYGGGNDQVWYGFHRFTDTVIGLLVALVVNLVVKPYNNEQRILRALREILDDLPGYLDTRVLQGRYPDLAPLRGQLTQLSREMGIYEGQFVRVFRAPNAKPSEAAYLRGCEQLAVRMEQELSALCCMDVMGAPDRANLARLREMGLEIPEIQGKWYSEQDNMVLNYHLENLLNAYQYLSDLVRSTAA